MGTVSTGDFVNGTPKLLGVSCVCCTLSLEVSVSLLSVCISSFRTGALECSVERSVCFVSPPPPMQPILALGELEEVPIRPGW